MKIRNVIYDFFVLRLLGPEATVLFSFRDALTFFVATFFTVVCFFFRAGFDVSVV
jgi:hypothetical protein